MRYKLHKIYTVICLTLILSCGIIFLSCTGIKIEQKVEPAPGDWLMAGGSPEQQNISSYTLQPPLELLWDYNLEGGVGNAGICVSDAVLFINGLQGELFTLDVSTGGKIGNIKFLGKEAATAPVILGNDIIMGYAGDKKYSLASYNISAGAITWRKNYGYIQSSPIYKDGHVYFGNLEGKVYKVETKSGAMAWKLETNSPIHSTCAISGESLVIGNDDGEVFCINTAEGKKNWKIDVKAPVLSTPMISNNVAYLGSDDSNFCALNISDGSFLWKNNLKTKIISGSALYNNEQVIFGGVDGYVYCLNISDGSIKWKFATKGVITASPVISGNYIYITSYDSYVYCLDAFSGELLWSRGLENKSKTTPIVWKDFLFVAADDIVYCFTNKPILPKTN